MDKSSFGDLWQLSQSFGYFVAGLICGGMIGATLSVVIMSCFAMARDADRREGEG